MIQFTSSHSNAEESQVWKDQGGWNLQEWGIHKRNAIFGRDKWPWIKNKRV